MIIFLLTLYHGRVFNLTIRNTWPLMAAETFLEATFIVLAVTQ